MAESKKVDLMGMICPYCVMNIAKDALTLKPGEIVTFIVDDPLAHKAVKEEFGEYENLDLKIDKKEKSWIIKIEKKS
ncbi:MAG: sulfurtransferase TusA family protein [Candidatus Zixiibacteriota bacterium]